MGNLLKKLQQKKQKMQNQMQRGREVTEQKKVQKVRERKQRTKYLEPGTIRYGLAHRQKVGDLMKDALERRRNQREK